MLYYDRIDISERTNPTKSNRNKERIVCYYFFYNHGFKFQDSVCTGCHDLTILCLNISDIAIITVKNVNFCYIIYNINKTEAINLLKNSVLDDRGYIYKKCFQTFGLA